MAAHWLANSMKYKDLLEKNCAGIVHEILNEMHPNLRKVGDIKPAVVPKEPILYRWWFPEDSIVVKTIRAHAKRNKELSTLLEDAEQQEIEGRNYLALYFGKSNIGYRRYIQHSTGNVHTSTIRHTLYGLCIGVEYDKAKEPEISAILDECYFEWLAFPEEGELIECLESLCIALGHYPLNVEGNSAIDDKWRELIMSKRKIN